MAFDHDLQIAGPRRLDDHGVGHLVGEGDDDPLLLFRHFESVARLAERRVFDTREGMEAVLPPTPFVHLFHPARDLGHVAADAAPTVVALVHGPKDGDVVFVELVAVAPFAGHIHVDGAFEGGVFVTLVGIVQGAEKGGFVPLRLTGGEIDVETVGFFDIGDGVTEKTGNPVPLADVPGIGLGRSRHKLGEIGRRRHMTGSAVVAFGVGFLGDLPVQFIREVAAGMGRSLVLVVDRFMALFATVVVEIIQGSQRQTSEKQRKKEEKRFHLRQTLIEKIDSKLPIASIRALPGGRVQSP
jgi:hypothetical protein